mmetsp:Transcript_24330/g.35387  ORF Transcript_24330/g.35387 Transcript_24330/m.35387 type:complete len:160 (-) Transcript_24330:56-535(-)|eukprot:CAMPEP_0113951264 /NCGR_PEP_ID=MMETSP1339-20121228/85261_1 /TAXON_ID=94617 /ORGANISM="Fibrocapsa japonica" /LENGTH=159 /DNA_ID=CAMNT_0000959455 /DNA_START=23 /DNA_END=502 /DNA_ORIENTATION=+ /assembly_acc=CAM_ASM_000762
MKKAEYLDEDEELAKADQNLETKVKLLSKIEEFFSSPEYTNALGDFINESLPVFSFFDPEVEQPLEYYEVFQKYQKMTEEMFEGFISEQGIEINEVYEVCRTLCQQDDGASTCIDYLLASTEYEHFLKLVYDFYCMRNLEDGEGIDIDEEGGPRVAEGK